MIYAREIILRNCGRFTVIVSDFGSDYRTHTHVTSEALYASLTRGATLQPRLINLKNDPADFTLAYDVAAMPIWFLPGIFLANDTHRLPDDALDTTNFNVVHEFYPSTSQTYVFKKGQLEKKDRPFHVPTYGSIQAIKPGSILKTLAFSTSFNLLEKFLTGQTFLLGKKRTMVQILSLSDIKSGKKEEGKCSTPWLELNYDSWRYFQSFEVLAITHRYIIIKGDTREKVNFVEFCFSHEVIRLPDFYFNQIPLKIL